MERAIRSEAWAPAPSILYAQAERAPDHVRFVEDGRAVTLGALAGRVAGFAAWLRQRGVGDGDRVALFAPNCVDWIVAALGVQAAGAAFAAVHAGSSAALARHVVAHSGARLVVAAPEELARAGVRDLPAPILPLGATFAAASAAADARVDHARLNGLACLIYTSGTTGAPKGVMLTHRNLAANAADWVEVCGPLVPEGARELLWLPLSHIFGWGDACIGTLMGYTSVLTPPSRAQAALAEVRPHLLMTVPVLLERLAAAAPDDATLARLCGGRLQLCLAGGAALSPAVKRRFRAAGVLLLEGYGLTETSPTLTLCRPDDPELDTVGRPYPSVELRLADDGEVLARGPSVFGGYFRDPDATRAALDDDGWFHTGDIGRFTATGQLRIIDRKKELIVLANGKKIWPQPIEARAAEEPWIERLVLFGPERPALLALVVLRAAEVARDLGRTFDAHEPEVIAGVTARLAALNAGLSDYERIRGFVLAPRPLTVEEGHLTPSLKVRRRQVWESFAALFDGGAGIFKIPAARGALEVTR